ncbi:MAG: hypothetical protein ACM3NQ_07975 [Bacteroidales bacterium]
MSLVMHQALKDVRLLRPILIVWVGLVVALHALVLIGALAYVPHTDQGEVLQVIFNVLMALNIAGCVAVAVLVIQADPVLDLNAFWFTRPVSVPVLLAAKAVVIVLFLVVVPILIDVLTMVVAGIRPATALGFVPGALEIQVAWLLPVTAVAAITVTLAQFLVAGVAETVGCLIAAAALALQFGPQTTTLGGRPFEAVLVGTLLLLSVAILAITYGWRIRERSYVAAALAPFILSATLAAWPVGPAVAARAARPRDTWPPLQAVAIPLVVGQPQRAVTGIVEVLSIEPTEKGSDVTVRWTGPARSAVDRPLTYSLRTTTGEVGAAGWQVNVSPFVSTTVPVPQHISVRLVRASFGWTEWPHPSHDAWLRGAKLVVTEWKE